MSPAREFYWMGVGYAGSTVGAYFAGGSMDAGTLAIATVTCMTLAGAVAFFKLSRP